MVKRVLENEKGNIRDYLVEKKLVNRTENTLERKEIGIDFIKKNYTVSEDGKTIIAWSDGSADSNSAGTGIYFPGRDDQLHAAAVAAVGQSLCDF